MWSKLPFVLVILQLAVGSPVRSRRSPRDLQPLFISSVPLLQNFYSPSPLYVQHPSPFFARNYSLPIFPFLIPIRNIVSTGHRLIPISDLSVIARERVDRNDDAPSNQFRNLYGGYGTGLFFGGQGAGHGFYAYGK